MSDTGSAIVVDAKNAMGQIAADFAMAKAIAAAEKRDVAIAVVCEHKPVPLAA